MKPVLIVSFLIVLSACSGTSFKLIDPAGKPISDAVVLSITPPTMLIPTKMRNSVFVTGNDGNAEVLDSYGRFYIYKSGFHPIVTGFDVTGLFYDQLNRPDGFVYDERRPYRPRSYTNFFIKRTATEGEVKLYPVKKIFGSNYVSTLISKEAIEKNITIDQGICDSLSINYSIDSAVFTLKSNTQNLYPSDRFFFVGPIYKPTSHLKNKQKIYFYCSGGESELYKVALFVDEYHARLGGALTRPTILFFYAKIESFEEYLEPPTRPVLKELLYNPIKGVDLFTNTDPQTALASIAENVPQANTEESKFKTSWGNLFDFDSANNKLNQSRGTSVPLR